MLQENLVHIKVLCGQTMLDFALYIARKAGDFISDQIRTDLDIEHKGRIDLVTNVDRESQRIITRSIEAKFPKHSIVSEEAFVRKKKGEFTWYIDPLDGTTNFVHALPEFCVSVALYLGDEPYVGVCYKPLTKDAFYAVKGKGAFMNDRRIRVSMTSTLVDALLSTGFPYEVDNLDVILQRFSRVLRHAQGVRRLGSAALDLCYVACGIFDGFWEQGLKPWDMAAGALIVQEAGGRVSLFNGSGFDLFKAEILATNNRLHDALSKLL